MTIAQDTMMNPTTAVTGRAGAARRAAAMACAALAAGLLAGCSHSPATGSASPSATLSEQEAMVAVAACMRDKGFDVPDPDSSGSLTMPTTGDQGAMEEAFEQCARDVGQAMGEEEISQAEQQELNTRITECLRQEGYDVPDPAPDQGPALNVDQSVPEEALRTCIDRAGSALFSQQPTEGDQQ